jgi:hypothetical protein
MKAQMKKLGGPLTWVAMHTLFILILEPKKYKPMEINQVLFIWMLWC